ncbi:hypothetical protein ACF3NA_09640 [Alkanindiges sp. WGS2144]|uniref:hypothetical protein n=1 Tax=Alkanindiges sp. WGS2144 TaxID=3366808 RepID=UPI0037539143
MKKMLVFLLMLLLPLQVAWSAAAVFCQHENDTPRHWGHHQHMADAPCQQTRLWNQAQSAASSDTASNHPDTLNEYKKTNPSHGFSLTSHSDHLTGNQPALNPLLAPLTLVLHAHDYVLKQWPFSLAFYQPPVLEQPKPPLWPA